MAKKTFDSSAASVPTQEAVAQRAHEIWEAEGRPEGCALEHWFRAISELKAQGNGESRVSDLNAAITPAATTAPKRSRSRATSEKRFQPVSQ